MNKIILVGNLTKDPETRTTQTGHTATSFTVAVNRRRKEGHDPEADFFRVTVWDKHGEICQHSLTKGQKVAVTGTVSASTYQTKDGSIRASLDVMANEVEFLTPKQRATPDGFTPVDSNELLWG